MVNIPNLCVLTSPKRICILIRSIYQVVITDMRSNTLTVKKYMSQTTSLEEGRPTTFADIHPLEPAERDGNVVLDCDLSRYTVLCEPISPSPIETSIEEILSLVERNTFSDLMWNDLPQMSVDDIYQELSNLTPYHENGHIQEAMDY